MTRETSVEAYNTIRQNGLLSQRRWQVYDFVYQNGPCAARDATKSLMNQGLNSGSISTRFSELKEMGLLIEVGEKVDDETKMRVILWDVTDKLPTKLSKKKLTVKQLLKQALILLEEHNLLEEFDRRIYEQQSTK